MTPWDYFKFDRRKMPFDGYNKEKCRNTWTCKKTRGSNNKQVLRKWGNLANMEIYIRSQ